MEHGLSTAHSPRIVNLGLSACVTNAQAPKLMKSFWHACLPLVLLPLLVLLLFPSEWPRWVFMWTLAVVIFAGCKWLTWRTTSMTRPPLGLTLGYLFAWPGMNADRFLTNPPTPLPPVNHREWLFAGAKLLAGLLLYFELAGRLPLHWTYLVGWVGMVGLILCLHFGAFHLLSCAWRTARVDAPPLMDWPFAARSLSDFWGARWNTAFRDLTYQFLFRPLTPIVGPRRALLLGFLASGLIHELVITLPAKGGYGGPTLFFLIQGFGILVSRSGTGRRLGIQRGFRGWIYAMTLLALPLPCLFPPSFIHEIILPFMNATGALE